MVWQANPDCRTTKAETVVSITSVICPHLLDNNLMSAVRWWVMAAIDSQHWYCINRAFKKT